MTAKPSRRTGSVCHHHRRQGLHVRTGSATAQSPAEAGTYPREAFLRTGSSPPLRPVGITPAHWPPTAPSTAGDTPLVTACQAGSSVPWPSAGSTHAWWASISPSPAGAETNTAKPTHQTKPSLPSLPVTPIHVDCTPTGQSPAGVRTIAARRTRRKENSSPSRRVRTSLVQFATISPSTAGA